MDLILFHYDGTEMRMPNVKNFEFRTNHVLNWIKMEFEDGHTEKFHYISAIKTAN